jgi:transcription elongation factor Elf1
MKGSCQKCGGLLVVERVLDYYGPLAGVKCVNCGWSCRDPLPLFGADGGSIRRVAHK